MRFALLLPLVLFFSSPANSQDAALAWFTDAEVPDSIRLEKPADALPAVEGTVGRGIRLTRAAAVDFPCLSKESGMIGFWIRPSWNGDDKKTHRLLKIGDPTRNGLLVEKAASGMLRFVMASPRKTTASRADVSHWRAGEWHHVVVVWMSKDGKPLGLPLWIDRTAVDGPIAGGNEFLDPDEMSDKKVWIGDESAEAAMDELILRRELRTELSREQIHLVYRDYFRTAPYSRIAVDPEPLRVPADRRVVEGHRKQFGLKAGWGLGMEPVTDFAVRYGQWSYFDAKPFIRWSTSDENIATADENGLVTGASRGECTLFAEFRGMKAEYAIEVIPADLPDLDLIRVSRLPRYTWERQKWNPAPGEEVRSEALIENFGASPVPRGLVIRFELILDRNRNFRLDPGEEAIDIQERKIPKPLMPRNQCLVDFSWTWTDDPLWVRVTLDPFNEIEEICEANNGRCELNIARPLQWGYNPKVLESCYDDRRINHVGSFSYYDWINAQCDRFRVMLREAVWPTTSPVGVRDDIRTDNFCALEQGKWEDEPYRKNEKYYDGGFPVNEPVNLMATDAAILHEFGHTCMALPDLYGYPVPKSSVLLRDEEGRLYAGGELLPVVNGGNLSLPSSNNVPCGVGYNSLMNFCHLWLHPVHAGQIQHFAGYRGPRFWGVQGRCIPTWENVLQVFDVNDEPLRGAAVYTYHLNQTRAHDASTKYFYDRPKFAGHTDEDGCYKYPNMTDRDWDDPDTDEVEGEYAAWNPFARAQRKGARPLDVAFTPNVWEVQGLLLLKIKSGDQTEFAWLPLTEFNEAFYRGEKVRGLYEIRTSLEPSGEPTPLVKPKIPEAIRLKNLRPEAVAPEELTVQCGEMFSIGGSKSRDPEGQPLIYRWKVRGGHAEPRHSEEPVYKGKAQKHPGDMEFLFYVIDGLRVSDPKHVRVRVEPSDKNLILPSGRSKPVKWNYTLEEPAEDWFKTDYDDSKWMKGPGGFGSGNPPGCTIHTKWDTPHIWLRRTVDLPADIPERLVFMLYHDEDVEIFVNGVKAIEELGSRTIYRVLHPTPEGRAALKPGRNLIAVHCMNGSGGQFIDVGMVVLE